VSAPAAATYGGSFPHTLVVGFGREKRLDPGFLDPADRLLGSCRVAGEKVRKKGHGEVKPCECDADATLPCRRRRPRMPSARRSQPSRRTTTDSAC